jgi:hypothetical protein
MNALFVQVEPGELSGFINDPGSVEPLFLSRPGRGARGTSSAGSASQAAIQARFSTLVAGLPPELQAQLAARAGVAPDALTEPGALRKLMDLARERLASAGLPLSLGGPPAGPGAPPPGGAAPAGGGAPRDALSLEKAWHAVHYLLCGTTEPGPTLLSRAVMGGADIGDDEEGFSGYGPARFFTAAQVAEFARALERPEVEAEAAARFDAERMTELGIYPGFEDDDAEWALDGFRRLRDFYRDAAGKGRAVVTCLV